MKRTEEAGPAVMKSLKGAPGGIGWLMQHELRVFWRSGKGMPKSIVVDPKFDWEGDRPRQSYRERWTGPI